MSTNWQEPLGAAPPPNPPGNQPNPKKRFALVGILLVVIAGLAAAAGLVMVNRGDSNDTAEEAQYVIMDSPTVEPVFEPRDAAGNDPFFPLPVQLVQFQQEVEQDIDMMVMEAEANAEPGETIEVPVFDVAELEANVKTGLYGGTEENTCDPERLISFLYANPELGEAWAQVQGIPFSGIADYIRSLEVRVLAAPVNVLNHGYDQVTGSAYEIDTVLDAGTAVLVDANGDIRTRCYCGNPIKPKPPTGHMPPRCIVFGAYVFTVPGGVDKRENAVRDVLLTGKQTTLNSGAVWVEVKWGTGDDQSGWVAHDNLRKHYCPPPTTEYWCPGPGEVPVYANDLSTEVGRVTGTLNLIDGPNDMFGPIDPVGLPGDETIVGDFLMIHFTQAAPSVQNSGWVNTNDLNNDDCERIRQCINLTDTVRVRAGGADLDAALTGTLWVEFTGHFAPDNSTWTEVRMLDGTGRYGWIPTLFFTPLDDRDCTPPPWECVEGEATVWNTANEPGPSHLGHLNNASVKILDPVPQNGRINIEMADGGPVGWVDQTEFNGGWDTCRPVIECYITTGTAWTVYPTNGDSIGPIAMPTMLEKRGKIVDGPPAVYERIGVGGIGYWIEAADLIALSPERCDDGEYPCPDHPYTTPIDRLAPLNFRAVSNPDGATEMRGEPMNPDDAGTRSATCCVTRQHNTPNAGDVILPSIPTVVTVVDAQVFGGETWYLTSIGTWFRDFDVALFDDACVPRCPEMPGKRLLLEDAQTLLSSDDFASQILREVDPVDPTLPVGDCCVDALYTGVGIGDTGITQPELVTVTSGPIPGPGGTLWWQTSSGLWFEYNAVVPVSACEQISCPEMMSPDYLDELLDIEEATAFSLIFAGDVEQCCADGDWYNAPSVDGGPAGSLIEPAVVIVVGVSDDGEWYQVIIDGDIAGWMMASDFRHISECDGDDDLIPGCPEFSAISFDDEGNQLCCAAVGNDFVEVALNGNTREADDGGIEFETTDGDWIHADDFVGVGRCDDDATCPTFSLISPNVLTECCVQIVGADFEVVTLTGRTRDTGGGVLEYETVAHGWILETDFASQGRCAEPVDPCPNGQIISGVCCRTGQELVNGQCTNPCPTGQLRGQNGGCFTPETDPCAGIGDADNDGVCNNQDNCLNTGNSNQANADGDRFGDACDNCPNASNSDQANTFGDARGDACEEREDPCLFFGGDTDGDGVCDERDNCFNVYNPNQEDRNGDLIGDVCQPVDPCFDLGGDFDGDTVCDARDNCPEVSNPGQENNYGDNRGDACEQREPVDPCANAGGDRDQDGICDNQDDCVAVGSAAAGVVDSDGDNVPDQCDNCPGVYNPTQEWPYGQGQCFPLSFSTAPGTFNPDA